MKTLRNISIFLTACASLLLSSCKTDSAATGESLIDEDEKIVVYADTVGVGSQLCLCGSIISSPDSFLLGEMETPYGTLKADILTQFACPVGFKYPENAVADSMMLYITYNTWTGDGNDAIEVDAYYLDKGTLNYNQHYNSNIDLSNYWSEADSTHIVRSRQVITPAVSTDVVADGVAHIVEIPLTKEFCQKFFQSHDFSDQKAFNQQFGGLYITTTFGGSVVLNINSIQMLMHYHFTYDKAGQDTTVYDSKGFFANSEVRQVNRFQYLEEDLIETLSTTEEENYIVSPAGVYTRVNLPLRAMCDKINLDVDSAAHRPYVNRARLRIEVLNHYIGKEEDKTNSEWAQPAANILLIRESALDRWFVQKEPLTDTCAINSSMTQETDSVGRVKYYYSYDLSTILTNSLRQIEQGKEVPDTLNMMLVPVDVKTNSTQSNNYGYSYYYGSSATTTITGVRASQLVSNTIIRSAKSQESPMQIEVVYSGF